MLVQLLKLFNVTQEYADDGSGVIATADRPVYAAVPGCPWAYEGVEALARRAGLAVDEDTGDADVSVQHMRLTQRRLTDHGTRYEGNFSTVEALGDLEAVVLGPSVREADLAGSAYRVSRLAWTHGPMGRDQRTETELEGSWEYEAIMRAIRGYVKQNGDPERAPEPFIYAPPR